MEKAQKSALVRHIFSITETFRETLTPPKGSERAKALFTAIKGKFGCQEAAVFDLVSAITGEDLKAYKDLKKVRPKDYTAFRVVTPNVDWRAGEIFFLTACDDNAAVGIRDGSGNSVAGALRFRESNAMVPATLKEIEAALSDELAQYIVERNNIVFL